MLSCFKYIEFESSFCVPDRGYLKIFDFDIGVVELLEGLLYCPEFPDILAVLAMFDLSVLITACG